MTTLAAQYVSDGASGVWKFADAIGSTTATDQIANSDGAYSGTFSLGVGGIAGGGGDTALQTNGGQCAVPDVAAQRTADTFTFEVWLKRATIGVQQGIMGGKGSSRAAIRFTTANTIELFKQSVSSVCTSTVALTDTTSFHQIAVTKSGSTVHMYLDGVDVTGSVVNATMSSTSGVGYQILWDFVTTFTSSGATYSYAAVFPTALNSTKIASHYTAGTTGTAPTNTAVPVVSGSTRVGGLLSSTSGSWTDVYGGGTAAYQWQRDSSGGGTYVNVSNGSQTTYQTRSGDAGCYLRCAVTFTNSGGSATANSSRVGPVLLPQGVGVVVGVPG